MKYFLFFLPVIMIFFFVSCKENPNDTVINNYFLPDSLTNPNVQPRVVFTNPANNEVGPFDNYNFTSDYYSPRVFPQITIQFNKLINVSNLNNKSVSMSTEDTTYILGLYENQNSSMINPSLRNILIFQFSHKYLANKKYTVTIDTTLEDVHRNKLKEPFVFSYIPEPRFRIYSSYPNTTDINPNDRYVSRIELNSNVDSTFLSKIQISPSIKGKWDYYHDYANQNDSTSIHFTSEDSLLYDTKYTISIPADAKDSKGLGIDAAYQFSFTTQPFLVILSSYSYSTGSDGSYTYFNLTFASNGDIDTSSVRSSISITPNIPFDLYFNYNNQKCRSFYIKPDVQKMERSTTYKITISKTFRSKKGDYLKQPYNYSFTTGS